MEVKKVITPLDMANKADLVDGKVPAEELPSYVDDVIEYADVASFPATGEFGKIYVALDTGYTYRWSGSEYIQIGGQDLSVITGNFAEVYDPTATYEEGDFCIYEDAFYVAKQNINPAEAWDASHWDRATVAAAVAELQAEVNTKQDTLVSGTNIKTVNGKTILGSGNMEIEANRPIPASWNKSSTTATLCQSIVNDDAAVKGMVYLGKINCSDLPGGLVQGEATISIISSGDANGKDIRITLTSADTAPYHWEYEYVRINGSYGSPAGWVGYQPELKSGQNIKTLEGQSLLGAGNIDLTKSDVGLGNVDNTSDLNKPISTAVQNALDLKANASALQAHESNTNNPHSVTKTQVGLDNVDNTSDADKPISTATQTALNLKADASALQAHESNTNNPHSVTKVQVGLGNVDNTSDLNKPISTAQQAALNLKQDIIEDASELEVRRLFRTQYTITGNVTDGTLSGDATIWTQETATTTITPDTGHILPDSVTVTGAMGVYDPATGGVALSAATGNVSVTAVCPLPQLTAPNISLDTDNLVIEDVAGVESYDVYVDDVYATNVEKGAGPTPSLVKGDIISFDALGNGTQKRFRVIDVIEGNTVRLLGMDDDMSSAYNSSNVTTTFDGGKTGQKYDGSTLDILLNTTYYNSLSSDVKNAIIDESIVQRMYSYKNPDDPSYDYHQEYNWDSTKMRGLPIEDQTTVGSRHVYALDIADVFSYLGKDTTTSNELMEMFFETTSAVSQYIWVRSASADSSTHALRLYGNGGGFGGNNYYDDSHKVRPAFKIDLTNINYTKEANA